jgi:hypothetical protein
VDASVARWRGVPSTGRFILLIDKEICMSGGIAAMGANQLVVGRGRCGVAAEVPVSGSTTQTIR